MNNIIKEEINTKSDYIIFDFKKDFNLRNSIRKSNKDNNINDNINVLKKNNYIFGHPSKEEINKNEEKETSLNKANMILNKTIHNIKNNSHQSNTNTINYPYKLDQQKKIIINDILKLKNKNKKSKIFNNIQKKAHFLSKAQQTFSFSSKQNLIKFWRNNSLNNIISKSDYTNSLQSNINNNINSFIFKEKNNSNEKIPNMPALPKNKSSINIDKEIYNQKKHINKRLSYLKKAMIKDKIKKMTSSLVSIEQYQRRNKDKKIPLVNIAKTINYDKLRLKPYSNYILDKNIIKRNKNISKEKNIFSQILFSIVKLNREKSEDKFEFKLHKPSNINIFTMIELNKKKDCKYKNSNKK